MRDDRIARGCVPPFDGLTVPERNASIAAVLDEIADLLDIQGANPFRVRAYRNAARGLGDLGTEVDVVMANGTPLTDIPGIGADLAQKIVEIMNTGTCEFLEQLHRELPPAITQLLRLPALGPRRVKTLYRDLHIENLEQLLNAARAGQIRSLPGFGEKTEKRIIESVQGRLAMAQRHPLVLAARLAEPLAEYLREVEGVSRVEIAGSYRRMRSTAGDIDMVAIAAAGSPIMDRFAKYPEVSQILSKGPTRSSVLLAPGLQVDLRSVPQQSFGAAMVYFTGSKAHNIAIRRMGQERGLKINEYGVFREEVRVAGDTEESVYATIDLPWIPPELREDRGEIEAARNGELSDLVKLSDVQGDLHVAIRPGQPIAPLLHALQTSGLRYVALILDGADESFDIEALRREIAANDRIGSPGVLIGIEIAIGLTGDLTPARTDLSCFDLVIARVEGDLDLPRAQQTERVLKALRHQRVAILAQPRAANDIGNFDLDFGAIARAATSAGVALEVTLHPLRIPPPDSCLEIARRESARMVVTSNAADASELSTLRFSLGFARRGGLGSTDILNCSSLPVLRSWIDAHRDSRQ